LGVLESQYKKNITLAEGVKLALKAINAALNRDTATGNGVDVWTLTDKGINKVIHKELTISIE